MAETTMGRAAEARSRDFADVKRRIKSIFGGSIGNLVEWYDWYVYSAFALYFAPVFFPKGDPTAQLLNTAAIFAVGFVMRPIGAWAMGVYADHRGRKAGLMLSVSLMCVGSLLIAAAPGYASAGVLSPAILVVARIIQGLSLGGEYGSSATYLSEMADRRRRGFWHPAIPLHPGCAAAGGGPVPGRRSDRAGRGVLGGKRPPVPAVAPGPAIG